jgi:hypothetical protein
MKEGVHYIYRMMPMMLDLAGESMTLGSSESVAVLGLDVVFMDAYNTDILQV